MLTVSQVRERLIQPADLDTPVWRYMNVGRFLWLLLHKQLWFSPLDSFPDKLEGLPPSRIKHSFTTGFRPEAYGFPAGTDQMHALRTIRKHVFVSSWHLSSSESDVMWRSYCSEEGVVLKTSYRRLKDSVGGLPVGLVDYQDFGRYRGEFDPVLGAWLKRSEFSGDREVRVGLFSGWLDSGAWPPKDEKQRTYGMPIDWPLQAIQIVHAHPKADYDHVATLEEIVRRLAPECSDPMVAYSTLASGSDY